MRLLRVLCCCLLALGWGIRAWADSNYLVGEGDVLRISVYQNPDLETTVRVSGDRSILLPLLGNVSVKGLTIPQVSAKIAKLLSDGYIVNPQVNVFVAEFRSKKAVILGHVKNPGVYELAGPTTLLELISKAGGLAENAGDSALIKGKKEDGSETSRTIDIKALLEAGNLSENLSIQDGDNVYINKAGFCYVSGEVQRPGAYKIDNKTTVIKAITLAGGYTGKASRRSVNLVRIINGEKKTLGSASLDTPVEDEDIIVVPESFF
ncbi:MAG: periplasmic polysaccharide biosynthesis/export protein [Desulfobulbaceae bacterium A2]|nr:MAG: periplasmic polysaccharide biosynthesis/export protein [Desulfobulbaceae bacterium A2]